MINVKLLNDNATLPTRATKNSAGLDLYASEDVFIKVGSTAIVPTGVSLQFPNSIMAKIESRSGLASKGVMASGGIIDSDYTGEVKVILNNLNSNKDSQGKQKGFSVKKGDRIAQLLLYMVWITDVHHDTIQTVQPDVNNERNDQGFGSSGV